MSKSNDILYAGVTVSSDFDGSNELSDERKLRPIEISISPWGAHRQAPDNFRTTVAVSLEGAEALANALLEQIRVWREAIKLQGDRMHECSNLSARVGAEMILAYLTEDGKTSSYEEILREKQRREVD